MTLPFKSLRVAAVAVLTAGGLLAGCNWPQDHLHSLTITDNTSGVSGIPAHLAAGQWNFTLNASPQGGIQLARLRSGYSLQQLFKDVPVVFNGADPKAFTATANRLYANVTFLGGRFGPGTFSTFLGAGASYVAIDVNSNKYEAFAVDRKAVLPNYPAANLTLTGMMGMQNGKDAFSWGVTGTLSKAGTIHFVAANGDEPHFLDVVYLHPDQNGNTANCFNYQGNGQNPYCDDLMSTGIVSPLNSMTIPYSFQNAGTYIIACFVPNADTGTPHAFLGMVKTIQLH